MIPLNTAALQTYHQCSNKPMFLQTLHTNALNTELLHTNTHTNATHNIFCYKKFTSVLTETHCWFVTVKLNDRLWSFLCAFLTLMAAANERLDYECVTVSYSHQGLERPGWRCGFFSLLLLSLSESQWTLESPLPEREEGDQNWSNTCYSLTLN